jgi:1,4-dihydroxy-2-naphthoyl-CoA hydrolase
MEPNIILEQINASLHHTMMSHLGIKFTNISETFIEATMPVNEYTINPMKILHGGATMALVESVGSALSVMLVSGTNYDVRGVEINGNHLKSVPIGGMVTARATILHKGRTTHVCEIKVTDPAGNLVNISRMTNMLIVKPV